MSSQNSEDLCSSHKLIIKFQKTAKLIDEKFKKNNIPKKTINLSEIITLMKELIEQLPPPGSHLTTENNITIQNITECGQIASRLIGYNVKIIYSSLDEFLTDRELATRFQEQGLTLPTIPATTARPRRPKRPRLDIPTEIDEESEVFKEITFALSSLQLDSTRSGLASADMLLIDEDMPPLRANALEMGTQMLDNLIDGVWDNLTENDLVELPKIQEGGEPDQSVHPSTLNVLPEQIEENVLIQNSLTYERSPVSHLSDVSSQSIQGSLVRPKKFEEKAKKNVFRNQTVFKKPPLKKLKRNKILYKSLDQKSEFDIFGLIDIEKDINFDFITNEILQYLRSVYQTESSRGEAVSALPTQARPWLDTTEEGIEQPSVNIEALPALEEPTANIEVQAIEPPTAHTETHEIEPFKIDFEPQIVQADFPGEDVLPQESFVEPRMTLKGQKLLETIKQLANDDVTTFIDLCPIGMGREEVTSTFETLLHLWEIKEISITQTSPKPKDILITLEKWQDNLLASF